MSLAPGSLAEARARLADARRVAVLSGAGTSAESGLATFRGAGGLWRQYRPEDLATPGAYARDPDLVWAWYAERFQAAQRAEPNRAHRLLARLEKTKALTLVTQNVDGLHQRAGSHRVLELHGNLTQSRCERCGYLDALELDFVTPPRCSSCGARARPNVVWFGESLPMTTLEAAVAVFAQAEVALVIGTSGVVEPAASLARLARDEGAYVTEINPEQTPLSAVADCSLPLSASQGVALLLEEGAEEAGSSG